ncbi:MBL fold metallo-hydrolase [Candidatus Saccharibacteria bacterium]|nr:MBL fold metallo-hydrolase [candidate division Zixibacteria bacterium]NIT04126.1 MBL fold metallo-hydrolase [Candidatus Saccharibacteria bacterium]
MKKRRTNSQFWQGKQVKVEIPFSRAGVAQQIWIESATGSVLIDAGDGTLRDLVSVGVDLDKLKGIIFTHGHFDHVGGLHSLLGFLRMIGRKEVLTICAPKGCAEVFSIVDNFARLCRDTVPFRICLREIEPQEVFQMAEMKIKPFSVLHCGSIEGVGILDPVPALGYRISHKGEAIAITGDTGFCPSLKELVKGVDLAIIEATHQNSKDVDRETLEKVHLSEDLAKEIGKLAKGFILVHRGAGE